MKSGNRDKTEGNLKDAKGHAKEKIGEVTNDDEKRAEGKADQVEGHAQKAKGEGKKTFGK